MSVEGGGALGGTSVATTVLSGGGTWDDIQTALNGLPAAGGTVWLKNGTWVDSGTVEIITWPNKPVRMVGNGASTVISKTQTTQAASIQFPAAYTEFSSIEYMRIRSDGGMPAAFHMLNMLATGDCDGLLLDALILDANNNVEGSGFSDLVTGQDHNVTIRDCKAIGTGGTRIHSAADGFSMRNYYANDTAQGRVVIEGLSEIVGGLFRAPGGTQGINVTGDGVTISNCHIVGGLYGIFLSSIPDDCNINGNLIEGQTGANIYADGTWRAYVAHNILKDSGGPAIRASNPNTLFGGTFIGNRIENPTTYGIHMTHCENFTVTGNVMDGVAATGDGIRFDSVSGNHCLNNICTGNRIRNFDGYGINEVDANQDFQTIVGNNCRNNTLGTENINGVGTVAANNQP